MFLCIGIIPLDIENLKSKQKNKELVYNIMDPFINNTLLNHRFLLAKDNPSVHSTLAPDFEITGIFKIKLILSVVPGF